MTVAERMRRMGFRRCLAFTAAGWIPSWRGDHAGRPIFIRDHGSAVVGGPSDDLACWAWASNFYEWEADHGPTYFAQRAKSAARRLARKGKR